MTTELEIIKEKEGTITSLELVKQINMFREQEGNKSELRHDTLRDIIKNEFSEEILSQEILEKSISSNGGRPLKVYILNLDQAKQILMRESKFVRKAVIKYINKLEEAIKNPYLNMTPRQMMIEVLKDQENMNNRLDTLEQRVKEKITLDYHQQRKVQREVALRVEEILNSRPDLIDKKRLLFANIYRNIKNTFGVASYNDVLEYNLDDCLRLIQGFVVPYNFGEDK